MSLKLISLASGSSGNCSLIYSDNTAILCDAGISCSRICDSLSSVGFCLADIKGVVITHEHTDHILGLRKLTATVPLYAHQLTAKAIFDKQKVLNNYQKVDFYESGFMIGDIKVEPFRISHDAVYPLGYTFQHQGSRISVATDIGILTNNIMQNIKDSQVVLLESNHDENMVKNGNYAPILKRRILSNKGHLSNAMASEAAERLAGGKLHTLVLGHLSKDNNLPGLALDTVSQRLQSKNSTVKVVVALQNQISEIFEAYEK